jgi:hypothetical protein
VTAEEFAAALNGRPTGAGRWQAKCPGHPDRTPSLSVATGDDGRTLVRCWAGCSLDAILSALGLSTRDLFAGAPPSTAQARQLTAERIRCNSEARLENRRLTDRYRKLTDVLEAIAARLARMPDSAEGDALAKLFHSTLENVRAIEAGFDAEEQRLFRERLLRLARKSERVREAA